MTKTENLYAIDNLSIRKQRHIIKRIVVRGTLILYTPTCLGSGDAESPTDLPLLRDSISDRALLTGSSIAGALRNYLREYQHGYDAGEPKSDYATTLFGGTRRDPDGEQSPLIIDDSISTQPIQSELRDGVKINSITRTAADKAKYDLELLEVGTEFRLCFELLIDKKEEDKTKQEVYEAELCQGLAIALSGLEKGEISLGMKKRRGFGRCHVKEWQVWYFNLEHPNDRISWLNFEHWHTGLFPNHPTPSSIKDALNQVGKVELDGEDKRERFTIKAKFKLVGSLLIRAGQNTPGRAPDVVHLKSQRHGKDKPVLPGSSLAGVLRHRAERIVNTLQKPTTIIDEIFGPDFSQDKTKQAKASRLIVHETLIKNATDLVQNRIAIDRFTGGAYHGALFDEQPIFGSDETIVSIELELRNPKDCEIGLLLLLLKDLWTSDLPIGGESSIGRGRLAGKEATLIWQKVQNMQEWKITQNNNDETWSFEDKNNPNNSKFKDELENLVKNFVNHSKEVKKDE